MYSQVLVKRLKICIVDCSQEFKFGEITKILKFFKNVEQFFNKLEYSCNFPKRKLMDFNAYTDVINKPSFLLYSVDYHQNNYARTY